MTQQNNNATGQNHKMNVDLTNETEADSTIDAAVGDTPQGGDSPSPKDIARRLLDNSDGPSDALKGAQKALQSHLKEYQETKQRVEDQKSRIDSLEETAERVENLPEDALCLQTLEGGISVEVKSDENEDEYTREDLIDDIEDAIEKRENIAENEQERLQEIEAECATIRKAAADIENLKELTGGQETQSPQDTSQVPDENRWPEH